MNDKTAYHWIITAGAFGWEGTYNGTLEVTPDMTHADLYVHASDHARAKLREEALAAGGSTDGDDELHVVFFTAVVNQLAAA